ncbi:O-fucosyltransferase 9-like isoform X3 [Panicum virgatum]|uniref:O-fucosyltransferase 9-like isoform X3 n=1 Tax=Panicum virgatum TaxID=38727 RepID=UPI0019D60F6A|nr:O-fucosyltransferase 9-like isoform X3 [Panicum virgatum]
MPVPAAAASMRGTEAAGPRHAARRLGRVLDGRRRRAALLLLALAYAAAMLMLATGGGEGLGAGVVVEAAPPAPPAAPGSVYRSHLVFERLLPEMRAFAARPNSLVTSHHKKIGKQWKPCISKRLTESESPSSNGFLVVEANGGLNQQRISICDAIAVARILNATLVTPAFHLNSVWRDSSKFGDIFDEDHFIESLRKHVRVVKQLPEDVFLRFGYNISTIPNMRTKAFSPPSYYLQQVLPKMLELGEYGWPNDQEEFFNWWEDMVAFSCCTYEGGSKENNAMENARERSWRGKFHRPGRVINPEANRRNGRCPLTPLEVGMMLRGMGFDNTTSLYVASGKIYNAEKYMTPLRQLFPLLQTKQTLATSEELAVFKGHSSRLAALDYTLCLHSEVFVMTQGSNFPHFLMGHRRYMYGGHAKTIKPDKSKLVQLFDNPNIRWDQFKHHMQDMRRHSETKGFGLRKPQESIYNLPMPDCMCHQAEI